MIDLTLQVATAQPGLPDRSQVENWARAALQSRTSAELTVRLVGLEESAALNERYRGRQGATNVLSFPAELPPELEDLPLLGDIVICAPLVEEEAEAQGKDPVAHWAHLVVHGVLHLLGYDHVDEDDAERMESLETRLLRELGFPDPYR